MRNDSGIITIKQLAEFLGVTPANIGSYYKRKGKNTNRRHYIPVPFKPVGKPHRWSATELLADLKVEEERWTNVLRLAANCSKTGKKREIADLKLFLSGAWNAPRSIGSSAKGSESLPYDRREQQGAVVLMTEGVGLIQKGIEMLIGRQRPNSGNAQH